MRIFTLENELRFLSTSPCHSRHLGFKWWALYMSTNPGYNKKKSWMHLVQIPEYTEYMSWSALSKSIGWLHWVQIPGHTEYKSGVHWVQILECTEYKTGVYWVKVWVTLSTSPGYTEYKCRLKLQILDTRSTSLGTLGASLDKA